MHLRVLRVLTLAPNPKADLAGPHPEIPRGEYCYRPLGVEPDPESRPVMKTKPCPHWSRGPDGVVRCALLSLDGISPDRDGYLDELRRASEGARPPGAPSLLLWDHVKECGINVTEGEPE